MVPHRLLAFTIFLAMALLTACEREERATRAARDGILLLGNGAEPKALDPHVVQSVGDSGILRALYEGLCTYHPSDDSIHNPGVAERWVPNDDFTEWTFHLRKDARWSNGDPVTAHDFVYSYHRVLNPEMAAPYASMLYFLKNGKAFNEGDITDFEQVGVVAAGDHTLVCTLEDPAPYLPDVVKHTTWYPVHRPTIEKFGAWTDQFSKWQRPGNHVGNGAFKLDSWRINESVRVVPNPHYWDAANVKLKGINFYPLDNNFTEERAFRDGLIHKTYIIPPSLIDYHKEKNPDITHIDVYAGIYFFRCNVTRPPLDNKYLRKALACAIDRDTIVKYVMMGGQQPASGFTPPSDAGYKPPEVVQFDVGKAKEFLALAGYTSGSQVPPFEILINTSEQHKAIAEAVQDMWKKHLGISGISISNQEWKVFQQTTKDLKYQVSRAGWIGDYVDPTTFLGMWRTGDSNNETGWSSPGYDRLYKDAARLSDTRARYEKLREAEALLLDELPVLPVYWYTATYLLHPAVKNWNPVLLDNRDYKFIDLVISD